jgi:hypothetical protein
LTESSRKCQYTMAPEACFEKERHPVLGGLKFKFSRYFYLIYY